jgi:uncharacterized membrane protein YczE
VTGPRRPRGRAGRVAQLLGGLVVSATGIWLTIRAALGVAPSEVRHIGLADRSGVGVGTASIAMGLLLVAVVAALGVRPGIGTVLNVVTIGVVLNALLASPVLRSLPDAGVLPRLAVLLLGVAVFAVGCAAYVGAHLGPGPRDGLMVALHLRGGLRIGTARVLAEGAGLGLGWALGGPVGVGTVLFVLLAGPAVELAFAVLRLTPTRAPLP